MTKIKHRIQQEMWKTRLFFSVSQFTIHSPCRASIPWWMLRRQVPLTARHHRLTARVRRGKRRLWGNDCNTYEYESPFWL